MPLAALLGAGGFIILRPEDDDAYYRVPRGCFDFTMDATGEVFAGKSVSVSTSSVCWRLQVI